MSVVSVLKSHNNNNNNNNNNKTARPTRYSVETLAMCSGQRLGRSGSSGEGGGGAGGNTVGHRERPVRKELVPAGKVFQEKTVAVRCAHGESVCYPLAELEIAVGGKTMTVRAGVSDRLPAQLLLGRDVPELFSLLAINPGADGVGLGIAKLRTKPKVQLALEWWRYSYADADPC